MSLNKKGLTLFTGKTAGAVNKELKSIGAKHIGGGQYAYKTPDGFHTLYFKVEASGAINPLSADTTPFAYLENHFLEMFNRLILRIEIARQMGGV